MEILFPIFVYIATGFTLGVIAQTVVTWSRFNKKQQEVAPVDQVDDADMPLVAAEWQTTIETQMKFNDLIIRFRAIVLSVFILSIGSLLYIYGSGSLAAIDLTIMLGMLAIFWIACFILDLGYYHQLLLGSVRHARKFDENEFFRSKGLFGLTEQISMEISLLRTKVTMWVFYLLPIIIICTLMVLKELNLI